MYIKEPNFGNTGGSHSDEVTCRVRQLPEEFRVGGLCRDKSRHRP